MHGGGVRTKPVTERWRAVEAICTAAGNVVDERKTACFFRDYMRCALRPRFGRIDLAELMEGLLTAGRTTKERALR